MAIFLLKKNIKLAKVPMKGTIWNDYRGIPDLVKMVQQTHTFTLQAYGSDR